MGYQNPQYAGNTIWGTASKGLQEEDQLMNQMKQGFNGPESAAKGGYSTGQEIGGAAANAAGSAAMTSALTTAGFAMGGPVGAAIGAGLSSLAGGLAESAVKGDPKVVAQAPTDAAQGMQLDVSSPVIPGQQPQQQAQMSQAPLGPPPGQFNRDEYLRRFGGYNYAV